MSGDLKEMSLFAIMLLIAVGGLAYCGTLHEETFRECVKHHEPKDCRP